jgi:hypothetical protein
MSGARDLTVPWATFMRCDGSGSATLSALRTQALGWR